MKERLLQNMIPVIKKMLLPDFGRCECEACFGGKEEKEEEEGMKGCASERKRRSKQKAETAAARRWSG